MRSFPFFLLLTHFHHVSLVLAFLIPSFPFRTEESDTCANLPYFGCLSVISWYCPGTVLVLSWYCPGTVLVLSYFEQFCLLLDSPCNLGNF